MYIYLMNYSLTLYMLNNIIIDLNYIIISYIIDFEIRSLKNFKNEVFRD